MPALCSPGAGGGIPCHPAPLPQRLPGQGGGGGAGGAAGGAGAGGSSQPSSIWFKPCREWQVPDKAEEGLLRGEKEHTGGRDTAQTSAPHCALHATSMSPPPLACHLGCCNAVLAPVPRPFHADATLRGFALHPLHAQAWPGLMHCYAAPLSLPLYHRCGSLRRRWRCWCPSYDKATRCPCCGACGSSKSSSSKASSSSQGGCWPSLRRVRMRRRPLGSPRAWSRSPQHAACACCLRVWKPSSRG